MLNNDFRIFYEFIIKFCYQIVINIFYVLKKTLFKGCQVITSIKR